MDVVKHAYDSTLSALVHSDAHTIGEAVLLAMSVLQGIGANPIVAAGCARAIQTFCTLFVAVDDFGNLHSREETDPTMMS